MLQKNFPKVSRYFDIKNFNVKPYENKISLLTGGFPCQPFSIANRDRKGTKDNRYLWPEMFRIIKECKPECIIGENVPGIIKLALKQVLTDLERNGYYIETFIIPACAKNAPHKRDRVWIIAYTQNFKDKLTRYHNQTQKENSPRKSKDLVLAHTSSKRWTQCNHATKYEKKKRSNRRTPKSRNHWQVKPRIHRVAHGVPNRLERIKALGNAIVPQIAEELMNHIYTILTY